MTPLSVVVATRAKPLDFTNDYVSLPPSYGTPAWDAREDITAIRAAVRENLTALDERVHFTDQLRHQKVILKPNLVTVFHDLGMRERDYPESTDPRVLDAVVEFLQDYTTNITIAESSGRGMPTRASFRIAGLRRLAKRRGVKLVALEEQPVDRYLLPRARVMQEVLIPRLFSEVVRGEAFYISMPKMKTNLYTGVTLGFKNAMGILAYNLRQRNHTFDINQKLVDLMHLVTPDLVIIDGIVGGEGNCPAPVMPVQSRVIVSGNHPVETDRVAARMMGFGPTAIPLLRLADENGFADPQVEVLGDLAPTNYQPADPSLWGEWMHAHYPNVTVLTGHTMQDAPQPDATGWLPPERRCAMEAVCRGGCLATSRFAFDMLYHEGQRTDFQLTVLIGAGAQYQKQTVYFDRNGRPFTLGEIEALPGRKLAVGNCAAGLQANVDAFAEGCMPMPNTPHMLVHQLSGTSCRVMSFKNRWLLPALLDTLQMCESRKSLLKAGERLDLPASQSREHSAPRIFSLEEQGRGWILEPFPPLSQAEIQELCRKEDRSVLATFRP